MPDLFFDTALARGEWARDVRVSVAADGSITELRVGAGAAGAERHTGVAVPGVPNVHSHAFQRALAGLTERGSPRGDTFWSWRERMYAFLQRLRPDDIEAIAAQLQIELLRQGFTAVTEFHYLRNTPDGAPYDDPVETARRIVVAAERTGIGLTLLPTLYLASDFGGAPPTSAQRRFVTTIDALLDDVAALTGPIEATGGRVGLALHSLRAVPPEPLRTAVEALRDRDPTAPVHIHVAEQEREVEACRTSFGARPVAWLLDQAPVDERWCLVHATHVDDAEIAAMAASGAVVALCPTTEANLGDGIFPLAAYQGAGGRWAVGTDSHVGVSPAGELRTLEYGQRLAHRVRNVAAGRRDRSSGRTLLDASWAGGAQASGRPLGVLEEGARADIVLLDPRHPALAGREGDDLLDAWIFAGDETPVRDVMVGGRWVVRDGRHDHQEEVADAYRAVARRLGGAGP